MPTDNSNLKTAIFAGGCFWCMEPPYDNTEGVVATDPGYSGGQSANPTYDDVSTGKTGHYEVIRVMYDPAKVNYQKLLEVFWHNTDPTDEYGQFADRGPQYQTAIFYNNEEEKKLAEESLKATEKMLGKPVKTKLLPAAPFYIAEDYHRDYYKKNGVHYNLYKVGSGRVSKLQQLWGGK